MAGPGAHDRYTMSMGEAMRSRHQGVAPTERLRP